MNKQENYDNFAKFLEIKNPNITYTSVVLSDEFPLWCGTIRKCAFKIRIKPIIREHGYRNK